MTDAIVLPAPHEFEAGDPRAEIRMGVIIAIFFFHLNIFDPYGNWTGVNGRAVFCCISLCKLRTKI